MTTRAESSYSDLVFQIFRYAIEQLSHNNFDAVIELGFTIEEISKISALTMSDMRRLSKMSKHFLTKLNIDHDSFSRMLERLEAAKAEETRQDELIKMGAPHAMMLELYGMNGHEYAQRRKLLSLTRVGRPPIPSEDDQMRIYQLWQQLDGMDDTKKWYKMGQELGMNLTAVWPLVKSWDKLDSKKVSKNKQEKPLDNDFQQGICV